MVHLAVRFLLGAFYATDVSTQAPEWPPHPDRLFSALVAAHYTPGPSPHALQEEAEALARLEAAPPPSLTLPYPAPGSRQHHASCPTNLPIAQRRGNARQRLLPNLGRIADLRPLHATPVADPIYFHWALDGDPALSHALGRLCSRLAHFGTAQSLVQVVCTEDAPDPTWVPVEPFSPTARFALRVPYPGRLQELRQAYAHQRFAALSTRWVAYGPAAPVAEPPTLGSPADTETWVVFRRVAGPTPDTTQAYPLAATLRNALLAQLDPSRQADVPAWIHGHQWHGPTRLQILPLFHVGVPHADGHFLGFGVRIPALPEHPRVLQAIRHLHYLDTRQGRILLERGQPELPALASRMPWGLTRRRWAGPARRWSTVTPVVFDRFPKSSRKVDAVYAMIQHAAPQLPRPLQAEVHVLPRLTGALPAPAVLTPLAHYGPSYVSHLTLVFPQPVSGPLALGRGRFLGLGLMAPLEEA